MDIDRFSFMNPLLRPLHLPPFSEIKPEHVEPALDRVLEENRRGIQALLLQQDFSWENLMQPLEAMDDELSRLWSPVSHMHSVVSSDELRAVYHGCLAKITDYETELGQNELLYRAVKKVQESSRSLTDVQKKILKDTLRDFELEGVALSTENKKNFVSLSLRLVDLCNRFQENLLDATDAWTMHITDEARIQGLPPHALASARQAAKQRKLEGWLLTLEYPSYHAAICYLDDRELRQHLYQAYVTRASELGNRAWDNSQIMAEILNCRCAIAKLVDFEDYAQYSLATKMAKTREEVIGFLENLAERSKPYAQKEYEALQAFATKEGVEKLEAWDIAYYSEKLREEAFDLNEETLREYFPLDQVTEGLFTIVSRLFGISIKPVDRFDSWHPDVRLFSIEDEAGKLIAYFYWDLYARSHKKDGAWMDECRTRRRQLDGQIQLPVAYLTCNFNQPMVDEPALLTHQEVITLFHEFGHGLHHMLTQMELADVSGINGVPWDAVEFPSQFLEQWCWDRESLALFARHYKTQEPMPDELFNSLKRAQHFQSGMQMMRQLEFSLFDFKLHMKRGDITPEDIQEELQGVRRQTTIVPIPEFNRFAHSFSHIFAGGYAAGYYSYKWAELLACDAFGEFEKHGIFDKKTGRSFKEYILEKGGSEDPLVLFQAFCGRSPSIDALLKHSGLE